MKIDFTYLKHKKEILFNFFSNYLFKVYLNKYINNSNIIHEIIDKMLVDKLTFRAIFRAELG